MVILVIDWTQLINGDTGNPFADLDAALTYISANAYSAPGGGGGSTDVAWADITGVPVALTASQAAATPSIRAIGTGATNAAAGNHTHADVVAAGASGFMSGADKTKLNGIATAATANATDASLRDRSTHTGSQAGTTVNIAAGTDGLAAGNLQVTLQALATRIAAVEV